MDPIIIIWLIPVALVGFIGCMCTITYLRSARQQQQRQQLEQLDAIWFPHPNPRPPLPPSRVSSLTNLVILTPDDTSNENPDSIV